MLGSWWGELGGAAGTLQRALFVPRLFLQHFDDTSRCITSPEQAGSLAFHARMGFRMEPGDRDVDGVPVQSDYGGPGLDRVSFVRALL